MRRVNDGVCRECNVISVKKWREKTGYKTDPKYYSEWRKVNKHKQKLYDKKRSAESIYFRKLWRGRLKRATPKWISESDKLEIKEIYELCVIATDLSGISHDVDHIIPLNGKNVCGLHVPTNLQILTSFENRSKGNRMENEL